jgi:protein O-mannosyl-transferase
LVTIRVQHAEPAYGHVVPNTDLAYRVAASGWIPWFYMYKDILPSNLCVIYPKWRINPSVWWAYTPGILLVGCLAILWRKRANWGQLWFFALACFVATLVPVLGLVETAFYADTPVTDHWQYFAIPWVIGLTVAAGVYVCNRLGERRRSIGTVTSVLVLAVLGMGTWGRCRVYADEERLWRDNLAKNPEAWMAHNNLGGLLMRKGDISDAVAHFKQAVQIEPGLAGAHYNLGNALAREGNAPEAIQHYEEALRIKPDFAEAHYNLGVALMGQAKLTEAIEHYQQALRIKPDFAEAHGDLGFVLQQMGRTQEAAAEYEQALQIRPDYVEAHYNLGFAFEKLGRMTEAIEQYQRSLKLRPDFSPAGNALARLLPNQ